jgi:hypothetical protein
LARVAVTSGAQPAEEARQITEPAAGSAAAWAEEASWQEVAKEEAAQEETAKEEAAKAASLAAAAADAPAVVTSALPDLSFPFTASEDLIELRAALREVYTSCHS